MVIGKNGDLPWHFKSDLAFFKETTMGHKVAMGRVTYKSIVKRLGKPLPGRETIVLTRDIHFSDPRVRALNEISWLPKMMEKDEWLFVIGGDEIFKQTINMASRIYLTYIEQEVPGDAYFPAIDLHRWRLSSERPEMENGTQLFFRTYDAT